MLTDLYQRDLSLKSPILLDADYKRPKVAKMLAVLEHAGVLGGRLAVDVGCSRGLFCAPLADHFDQVVGVDIDAHALAVAAASDLPANVALVHGDSLRLPLPDGSVDVVVCNHVYEHVPSAERLFAEIRRVLRGDGACYLGAASRLVWMEPHYHLPGLSWLPRWLAHRYMRLTGRGERYYERLRTWWGIRRLLAEFEVEDYTLRVLAEPDRFHADDLIPAGSVLRRVPGAAWRAAYPLLPGYLLILRPRSRPRCH